MHPETPASLAFSATSAAAAAVARQQQPPRGLSQLFGVDPKMQTVGHQQASCAAPTSEQAGHHIPAAVAAAVAADTAAAAGTLAAGGEVAAGWGGQTRP